MTNNFEHLSKDEFEEIRKVYYSQAYEIVENLQELLLGLETNPAAMRLRLSRGISTP